MLSLTLDTSDKNVTNTQFAAGAASTRLRQAPGRCAAQDFDSNDNATHTPGCRLTLMSATFADDRQVDGCVPEAIVSALQTAFAYMGQIGRRGEEASRSGGQECYRSTGRCQTEPRTSPPIRDHVCPHNSLFCRPGASASNTQNILY